MFSFKGMGFIIRTAGVCKSMNFSQSALRTQRKESIKPALSLSNVSILLVTSVCSVRDIFSVFTQPHKSLQLQESNICFYGNSKLHSSLEI